MFLIDELAFYFLRYEYKMVKTKVKKMVKKISHFAISIIKHKIALTIQDGPSYKNRKFS